MSAVLTDAQIIDAVGLIYHTDYQDDPNGYDIAVARAVLAAVPAQPGTPVDSNSPEFDGIKTPLPVGGALDAWRLHAGVKALLQCTEGELECISSTLLDGYEADVQRVAAAIATSAQQTGAGQWLPCTPHLILAGVNCAETPRRPGATHSHDHWIAHGVAGAGQAAAVPVGYKLVAVNSGFGPLVAALDYASGKGCLPDALVEEWEAFDFTAPQPAPASVADKVDAERLDFVLHEGAFLVWANRDDSIKQVQLWSQDEDEDFTVLSGDDKFFNSPREAIDASILAAKAKA